MEYIVRSAVKSLKGLTTPGLLWIFFCSFLVTLGSLMLFLYGVFWGLTETQLIESTGAETTLDIAGGVISFLIAWALFPIMLPIIVSFFDEKIADLVEKEDYPGLPRPQYPFWPTFWQDVGFTIKAVLLNVLVLPLYLVPVLNIFLYYLLNGYLLGKQFFRMAAIRHVGHPEAEAMMRQHRSKIILAGMLVAFLATIPFANLIAPFWGVAMLLHLFHDLWKPDVIEVPYVEVK